MKHSSFISLIIIFYAIEHISLDSRKSKQQNWQWIAKNSSTGNANGRFPILLYVSSTNQFKTSEMIWKMIDVQTRQTEPKDAANRLSIRNRPEYKYNQRMTRWKDWLITTIKGTSIHDRISCSFLHFALLAIYSSVNARCYNSAEWLTES